ncbi:MAG: hypothetical protein V3T88_04730 [Nitrosomonadaceae bacterium]
MKIRLFILSLILICTNTAFAQYEGETFAIDCSRGGFNNDLNADRLAPEAMVENTRNINLHKGGRSKRGGTFPTDPTPITGTPRIYGIYQFRLQNGNEFIVTATGDGKIQSDYSTEIKTGLTINQAVHFVTFNNLLIICTGNDLPEVWTGTGSTSALANTPTDWNTTLNYPRKMITHGRGASLRLWAIGGAVDPFTVYASDLSAKDGSTEPDFSDANVITIYVDTEDGTGIVNAVEFGDRLMCSGKSRVYIIDDLDTLTANWGYEKSQWEGGTANDRTMLVVANDVISMTDDGTIYSVVSAQNYGDYKKATLTRDAFIDEWIRENIRLLSIDDFHAVYDPVLRCVYFFLFRQGQDNIDTALCYFIDRVPTEAWVIKDNQASDSGYKASASALVRKAIGDNKVYTGGWDDGFVWELETTAQNDNGAAYAAGFKTPRFHLGNPRETKRFDTGWLITSAQGNYNLLVDIWVDGVFIAQETVSLAGVGSTYGGGGTYGVDAGAGVYGGSELIEVAFPIGVDGKRLELHVFNNSVGEDFFVTLLMVDFLRLGNIVATINNWLETIRRFVL